MLEIYMQAWTSGPVFSDRYITRFCTEGYCAVMANKSLVGVVDEIIEREIAHHESIGRSFEWTTFSTDEPADLALRLEKRGFEVGTKEVACMIPLADCDFGCSQIRVERVIDESTLADFRAVAEGVFGKDYSYTTGVLAENLALGAVNETGFVAYDGKTPVSVGRLSWPSGTKVAGMYTGGTLTSHRGKGFYRAVVAARADFARGLGVEYLSVDARPTSLPILQRLGFVPVVESWPCEFTFEPTESV